MGVMAAPRCGLLVLALLAFPPPSAPNQVCIQGPRNSSSIPQAQYSSNAEPGTDRIWELDSMMHKFLGAVQPNPFPTGIIKLLVENVQNLQDSYVELVQYEVGYIVGAATGILFLLLMPLVGLFFCCCRCCGRCGGRMYQKQSRSMACRRRTLAAFLFVVTSIILAGNVCMFISNEKTSEGIQESEKLLNTTLGNLKIYIQTIPIQVTAITNASSVPINLVTSNLNDISSNLGEAIKDKLGESIYPALRTASDLAQELKGVNSRLVLVNKTGVTLVHQQDALQQNLSIIQKEINDTLAQCGGPCAGSQNLVSGLTIIANFSKIPNMDKELEAMKQVVDANLQSFVQEGYRSFNDTPAMVASQAASTVSEAKKSLKEIETQIETIKQDFPILNTIHSTTSDINNINNSIYKYYPNVQQANNYRWIVGIVLSCIILLIVVCNYLGLLLGTVFLNPKVSPTERSCSSHSGGNFLMAGVGFSFIFSWLLMLLVLIMFFVGGNIYTLVCRPWYNEKLLQAMNNSGLMNRFNLEQMVGLNTRLDISIVYRNCQNNTSAWKALNLGKSFNLDEHLNLSKYTEDIKSQFENLNVNLSGIVLLNNQGKKIAKDVFNTGVDDLNFTSISEQLTFPLILNELLNIAEKLQNLSKILADPVKTELNNEAESLKQLNGWIKSQMEPNVQMLKENIQDLQVTTSNLEKMVNTTLLMVESAQTLLHTRALDIIKSESEAYLDCQLSYFSRYVKWTKREITQEVARCRPAANVLDSVATISCVYILDSLNTFWFSMGWSTIFLIPSIIFAVKLAKYYRRMTSSDVYENGSSHLEMRKFSK